MDAGVDGTGVEKNHPANHANGIRQIRNLGVKVLRG